MATNVSTQPSAKSSKELAGSKVSVFINRWEKIKPTLERTLKIRPGDWDRLLLMLPLFLLLNIGMISGNIATSSLFLNKVGAESIRFMYFFNAAGLFIISMPLASFVDKVNKFKLFHYTLWILAFTIFGYWLILLSIDIAHLKVNKWFYGVLFVSEYTSKLILMTEFWLIANELCDIRQAKRLFGLISSGGIIGSIFCSFVVAVIARITIKIGDREIAMTENIYLIWAGALIGCTFILKRGAELFASKKTVKKQKARFETDTKLTVPKWANRMLTPFLFLSSQIDKLLDLLCKLYNKDEKKKERITKWKEKNRSFRDELYGTITQWREGFGIVKTVYMLQILLLVIIFTFALSYTLDYQALFIFRQKFPVKDDFTQFFGIFKGIIFAVALFFQVFLTNRLLFGIGVHNCMLIYPTIYFIGFTLLAFNYKFIPAVIAAGLRDFTYFTIHNPAYQVMYNPVAEEKRGRGKAFIEGIGNPAALLTSALMLTVLVYILPSKFICFLSAMCAIIFFAISFKLKRAYVDAIVVDMQKDEMALSTGGISRGQIDIKAIYDAMTKAIKENDVPTAVFTADMFANASRGDGKSVESLIPVLNKTENDEIRIALINAVGSMEQPTAIPALIKYLNSEKKELRIVALKAIGRVKDQRAIDVLYPYLKDIDNDIRATSAAVLWRLGNKDGISTLKTMLKSSNPKFRVSATSVLTYINDDGIISDLINATKDTDPEVRRNALLALAEIERERFKPEVYDEIIYTFLELLGDRKPDRIRCSKCGKEVSVKETFCPICSPREEKKETTASKKQTKKKTLDKEKGEVFSHIDQVRDAAQHGLVKFGSPVLEKLLDAFYDEKHKDYDYRRRVIEILGQIQDEKAEKMLMDILLDSKLPSSIQGLVLKSLAKKMEINKKRETGTEGLVYKEYLEKYIRSEISGMYKNIFINIDLQKLKEKLDVKKDKQESRQSKAKEKPELMAIDMLIRELEEENDRRQDRILEALGLIVQEVDTFYLITRKLKSKDQAIRSAAIETLDSIGNRELVAHLSPLVEVYGRTNVINALKSLRIEHERSAADILSRLLFHPNNVIRACSAYLTGELKLKDAKMWEILFKIQMSDKEDDLVKENATRALEKLKSTTPGFEKTNVKEESHMMTTLEKIIFLKKVPMFSDMSGEELRLISQLCNEKTIPSDEIIMKEKEYEDYVYIYIVVSGVVSLTKTTMDGEEKLLKILKEKDYFGDIEVFDEETMQSSTTIKTMDTTRVLTIGQKEFLNLLTDYPRISLAICKAFSKKLQQMNKLLLFNY